MENGRIKSAEMRFGLRIDLGPNLVKLMLSQHSVPMLRSDLSAMARLLLAVLLLVIMGVQHSSAQDEVWLPCTKQLVAPSVSIDGSTARTVNTTVYGYPKYPNGDILEDNYVGLHLRSIMEVNTTGETCYEAEFPFLGPLPEPGRDIVGLTVVSMDNLECSLKIVNDTLPNGVEIQSIVVTGRNLTRWPDLLITFNVSLSSGYYNTSYPGNSHTNGIPYTITYRPGSYKINLEILNWPWADPTGHSHLVAQLTVKGLANITYQENAEVVHFEFKTASSDILNFVQDLDRGFLLDGVPYMNRLVHDGVKGVPWPANLELEKEFAFGFCQDYTPGIHYDRLYWDPQLTILFAPPQSPTSPDSLLPQTVPAKVRKAYPTILGATFGAVAAVTIGLVVAYFSSKTVQNFFRPFKTQHNASVERQVAQRWANVASEPARSTVDAKP